jgi:hypothetical protein
MVRDLAVMLDCTVEELTVVFRAARVARKRHCRWSGDGHARHKDQEGGSRFVPRGEMDQKYLVAGTADFWL